MAPASWITAVKRKSDRQPISLVQTPTSAAITALPVKTVNRGASHDAWVPDRKVGG